MIQEPLERKVQPEIREIPETQEGTETKEILATEEKKEPKGEPASKETMGRRVRKEPTDRAEGKGRRANSGTNRTTG